MSSIVTQNNLDLIFFKLAKIYDHIEFLNQELEIDLLSYNILVGKKKIIKFIKNLLG